MYKKSTSIIILICLFLLLPTNTYCSSIKEDYELQEKCGQRCDEYFRKDYGNGIINDNNGQTMTNYTNHYNKKQNKCFFLVTSTHIPKEKKKDVTINRVLFDINENKEYGLFVTSSKKNVKPTVCFVSDKSCNSKDEWDLLVKPYMEE